MIKHSLFRAFDRPGQSVTTLLLCCFLCVTSLGLYAEEHAPAASHSPMGSFTEQIWFEAGAAEDAKQVQVAVEGRVPQDQGALIHYTLHIDSDIAFRDVIITMTIRDAARQTMAEGHLRTDLFPGDNECRINWDATGLEPGRYTATFNVNYTTLDAAARYTLPFIKVTPSGMMAQLAHLENIHADIIRRIDSLEESSGAYPYFQIKLALIEDFVPRVRELVDRRQWDEAYPLINRLTHTANAINAEFAFSSLSPERLEKPSALDFSRIRMEDHWLNVAGQPVFLLGVRTALDQGETLERLQRFGVRLAVPEVTPAVSMSGPGAFRAIEPALHAYLRQAEDLNMAIIPALGSSRPAGWMMDAWPDLMPEGFLNQAHPNYQSVFNAHLEAVLPALNNSPNVFSAALLDQPRYKFDSERVRNMFIAYIRDSYPDRMTLNAAWRSHLADHEEITIWGDHPEYSYQNRRAYQYDWQQFHRRFIDAHLAELLTLARSHAPDLTYVVSQSPDAFQPGETRHNVDREALSRKMAINGLTTQSQPHSSRYSLDYPGAGIYYALHHSFNPQSPIFDLDAAILDSEQLDSERAYRYVNSLLWESAIAGVQAVAIAADSPVWEQPETLEALAVANLDINRLASIINAFQQAPTDIGILFSASSKILDDGLEHLTSAWNAFEGSSFSGYTVRFLTERQIQEGALDDIKALILPETPSLEDATFNKIHEYVLNDGTICRAGTPIPYTPHGHSRTGVLPSSGKTVLVRGTNQSTEYLHAVDAAIIRGALPVIARPINAHGYPLEGVKTRLANHQGETYLYVINVRQDPVVCHLAGKLHHGRDLIRGRDVKFPMELAPLDPMLIRLEQPVYELEMTAQHRR